jgi:pyruvate kinase
MIIKHNRTKIIATVGPSCSNYDTLLEMVREGVDLFRFNFSHGTHEGHLVYFENVHRINRIHGTSIGILADLQGPKIRIGNVAGGSVELKTGTSVTITDEARESTSEILFVSYPELGKDVKATDKMLIDDGKIVLQVAQKINNHTFEASVLYGGILSSKKGVNLPDSKLTIPSITEKDWLDLEFALKYKASWIALSFVRTADDILQLKKEIKQKHSIKIIAKIEKPEAVESLDEIIKAADGIMVARGDLGVELPLEKVPLIQKEIVRKCIMASKPVIVATQMMESMISNSTPTRAEVNDVANAMIDGADAVMLSGETSVGRHPVEVIRVMRRIMKYVEAQEVVYNKNLHPQPGSPDFYSDAVCFNACRIAEEVNAKAIVGMTRSGYTAFMLSSYRPHALIYVFTDNLDLLNILSLSWGVKGFYYDRFASTDETIHDVLQLLKKDGLVTAGDVVINTGSMPIGRQGKTNMLKVSVVD